LASRKKPSTLFGLGPEKKDINQGDVGGGKKGTRKPALKLGTRRRQTTGKRKKITPSRQRKSEKKKRSARQLETTMDKKTIENAGGKNTDPCGKKERGTKELY